jgi:ABC-type Fe3+ transport system permease subunit
MPNRTEWLSAGGAFCVILLAPAAARAIASHDFRGKRFLFFALLLPTLAPALWRRGDAWVVPLIGL